MRMALPKTGRSWEDLDAAMTDMAKEDVDWRGGRVPLGNVFKDDALDDVAQKAYLKFFNQSTALAKRSYPSLWRMEREVCEMALELFHAPDDGASNMTTGGSETILLAIKACRDWTRANKYHSPKPNIVVPFSAHPAFGKAGMAMDIEVRQIPVKDDFRADVAAMAAAIDEDTIMLVGSAPSMSYGLFDPISELSELALQKNIWLHVDACGGGYLAPFAKKLGHPIPDFDFSVPGVRSISADLHKMGYCPKPASTVLYRSSEFYKYQAFDYDKWPHGPFFSPNLTNTRPGGSVAAAWSVMQYLGESGYLEIAERTLKMTQSYIEGIKKIEGLSLWCDPELSIILFGSKEMDIFKVAERLTERRWFCSLVQTPKGIHQTQTLVHETCREEYLADLASAVEETRQGMATGKKMEPTY